LYIKYKFYAKYHNMKHQHLFYVINLFVNAITLGFVNLK